MRPTHWLPPVAWMGVILVLSSEAGSAEHTGQLLLPWLEALLPWASPAVLEAIHVGLRKIAHAAEYGLLAALWLRALVSGQGWTRPAGARAALFVSVAWALVDEAHQATVVTRGASLGDVLIDGAGALLAVALLARRRTPPP